MDKQRSANADRSETRRVGRRCSKISLPARSALAAITAVFLILAAWELGYVDSVAIALALLLLASIIRRPEPVHVTTAIALTAVTGILLWANLRPTPWEEKFGQSAPENLDLVTKRMFWRGWPLCPFMVCPYRHMTFLPEEGFVQEALIYDGVLLVAALLATKFLCEWSLRRRRRESLAGSSRLQKVRPPLVSIPTRALFLESPSPC